MQYTFLVNQKAVIDNFGGRLTLKDVVIQDFFRNFITSTNKKIKRITDEGGNIWVWVSTKHIISCCPILKIKSIQGVRDHVNTLINEGLLERKIEDKFMAFYRLGTKADLLVFSEPQRESLEGVQNYLGPPPAKESLAYQTIKDMNQTNIIKHAPNGAKIPNIIVPESFAKEWADWVQYRKQARKPLTELTMKQQIAFLTSQGAKAADIINLSITNGWQGLKFPSKNQGQHKDQKREGGYYDNKGGFGN